jgi:hypothetical protein
MPALLSDVGGLISGNGTWPTSLTPYARVVEALSCDVNKQGDGTGGRLE